ncbi:MAG: DUF357 domain-containing protein [Candidatus Thermoplasmatota archaeon]|nr:DUF357 domain-containing protein [Candidatus Thermoplasmatota archaeon]
MERREITEEHIQRYLEITKKALDKIAIAPPSPSFHRRMAEDFFNMAMSYYKDAVHFRDGGDWVNSFACINYAHGWLDCGARMGLFDVGGDHALFTLSE